MRSGVLNTAEIAALDRQDPGTQSDGGFQGLMVRLQGKVDRATGQIDLDDRDVADIPRHAFDYKNGGWQNRLQEIFGRTLGSNLGR